MTLASATIAVSDLWGTELGLLAALAVSGLFLVAGIPALLRSAGLLGPGCGRAWLALGAIVLLGFGVRWAAGPTFLREAYPLPDVASMLGALNLDSPLAAYPRGMHLLGHLAAPVLPRDPYEAWFLLDVLLGTLTIPAAWCLGAALTGRATSGLVAGALLAFWPQHVRLSASESLHVGLVLFTTLALAFAALSARRATPGALLGLVGASTAALLMRPEAPLLVLVVGAVALVAGPAVRDLLRDPRRAPLLIVPAILAALLVAPSLLATVQDDSAALFVPGSGAAEGSWFRHLRRLPLLLLVPSEDNAFFDPFTAPLWLWPLAVYGAVERWRAGARGTAIVLAGAIVSLLLFYASLRIATTIWAASRYHLAILPLVLALVLFALEDLVARLGQRISPLASEWRQRAAMVALAALGLALWWPAVRALPRDWQEELHWLLDLGRRDPHVVAEGVRVVIPDNRRRFRDLAPRSRIEALTGARRDQAAAVPVAEAIARLDVERTPALYLEGLYCWLALAPGEALNPQCEAMRRSFELEPIERLEITTPPYLLAYLKVRPREGVAPTLYRITRRRLARAEGLALLPPDDLDPRELSRQWPLMGSATAQDLGPATPPLP